MTDALDPLIAALVGDSPDARIRAIRALKRLGNGARPAVPALQALLDEATEPFLRISAAGAIRRIAPEDVTAVPVLVQGLSDPVGLHRAAACEFLGERRRPTAALESMALTDPEFVVRFAAAKAIGRTVDNWLPAVEVCVAMLTAENATDRSIGAACLLSIRPQVNDHLGVLTAAVAGASGDVRHEIEEVIAQQWRQE